MRKVHAWPGIRNTLLLFLLLFSSQLATQSVMAQGCGAASGDLYNLPACAVLEGFYPRTLADDAYLTSVNPQTIIALPGQNVSFAISYQIWAPTSFMCVGYSNCIFELLFVASWTPWNQISPATWWLVYAGIPPEGPPGTKGDASLHLTVPIKPGTYYLWFIMTTIVTQTASWQGLHSPGHIKVIVPAHTVTVTATNTVATVSPLPSIPLVTVGVAGIIVAVAFTSTILVTQRRRSRRVVAEATFANLDELLLSVDPHTPKQNRVLATVMFTDIVGSTQWATKLGDREWQDLLSRHFALVRKELERFHGREVGTTGDGMLAVFAGPERAVRCACSIRDVVHSLGLKLRIGVHTGEIQLTSMAGLDRVAGIAVHIGARVASQAEPDEILVSSTTKDLIAGSGIQFKDYGMHTLKGVQGEWHLFAVAAA
jgi:class 3 adenylate cyclase